MLKIIFKNLDFKNTASAYGISILDRLDIAGEKISELENRSE